MSLMKDLSKEEKPAFGQRVNTLKAEVSEKLEARREELSALVQTAKMANEKIDITLAGTKLEIGTTHPLIMIQNELEELFVGMGYKIAEGPEVKADYYNFELANIPQDHPAGIACAYEHDPVGAFLCTAAVSHARAQEQKAKALTHRKVLRCLRPKREAQVLKGSALSSPHCQY